MPQIMIIDSIMVRIEGKTLGADHFVTLYVSVRCDGKDFYFTRDIWMYADDFETTFDRYMRVARDSIMSEVKKHRGA